MKNTASVAVLIILLVFLEASLISGLNNFGINYGRVADNLPTPARVAEVFKTYNITRAKLYDADPDVLRGFAGSNVEFTVTIENALIASLTEPSNALSWIQQWVQPHLSSQTKITCITVGNEVFSTEDTQLWYNLLPAMQSLHSALITLQLDKQISVVTTHALVILASSYPPSSGIFKDEFSEYLRTMLDFHSKVNSPFLINVYPYFAYKSNPIDSMLKYALFEPDQVVVDEITNLKYDNMLYAQIDAVYAAMQRLGYTDVEVKISETGWPSVGDHDEPGATLTNADLYIGNLMKRLKAGESTPAKPGVPVDAFIFALFNENLKPGPSSERNYGLFYPDFTPVYKVLSGADPTNPIPPTASAPDSKFPNPTVLSTPDSENLNPSASRYQISSTTRVQEDSRFCCILGILVACLFNFFMLWVS